MKEQITRLTCDRCGSANVPGTQTVDMLVDRRSNGQDKDDVYKVVDLCPECLYRLYIYATRMFTMKDNASICHETGECQSITWREELR